MKRLITTLLLFGFVAGVQAQEAIESMLEREGYYQHFSGNALIQTDSLNYQGSFGMADIAAANENELSIPSDIGSISKQFTAAAILHLVQEGKLDLTQPINSYLGDHASSRWKKVTIHHLLTHTSGIPSLFQSDKGMDEIWPTKEEVSKETLIGYFNHKKLLFKPGKKYSYSNSGYVLLAVIIEQVSGKSYKDYLEQEIFKKYGLATTTVGYPENGAYSKPYFGYRSDLTEDAPLYHRSWMLGAGGIYSTVGDLSIWIDTVTSESFLTAELRKAYFGEHVSIRGGYYGYGWETISRYGIIQHDGTNFGYVSYLGFNPTNGDRVILLTNQTYASIDQIGNSASYLRNLQSAIWNNVYDQKSLEELPTPAESDFAEGIYSMNDSVSFKVIREDSVYHIKQLGALPITGIAQAYPIRGDSAMEQRLVRISGHLLSKKFRKLKSDCDKQMKLAVRLGIISLGYNMITSDLGDIEQASPYHVNDKYGLIRLAGSNGVMDLIIYFDESGLIQGIFEHGRVSAESAGQWIAFPVEGGELFIDGFPYGEDSVYLTRAENQVTLRQYNRVFDVKTDVKK